MKKASSGRNLDANLEMIPMWKGCPLFIRSSSTYAKIQEELGRIPPKIQNKSVLLACLAQRLCAFTSRCGTDTAGREALEPPPEDGARTKLFDREFQCRESHTEAETKKNS